jgi:predicted RNase H-like HicB family nuclease
VIDPAEPFRPPILQKAREIARDYKLTIEKSERLSYLGSSVEIPTVFADGNTPDKCYQATQEALSVAVAAMLEAGQTPPQPAAFMKRTTQVNVRLTVPRDTANTFFLEQFAARAKVIRCEPQRPNPSYAVPQPKGPWRPRQGRSGLKVFTTFGDLVDATQTLGKREGQTR